MSSHRTKRFNNDPLIAITLIYTIGAGITAAVGILEEDGA